MAEAVSGILMERGVPATMRDGTVLRADVYRPAKEGRYPVLLERIPYNKNYLALATLSLDVLTAAHAGYVVVVQDVRARFSSDGRKYYIYRDEWTDGYDAVEWAAALPYSNGNVGMFGVSYMGMTQFQAAAMRPPHLRAIFPVTWGTDVYLYRGGAFELGLLFYWALAAAGPDSLLKAKAGQPDFLKEFLELVHTIDRIDAAAYEALPLKEAPWLALGDGFAPYVRDILDHDRFDDFHRPFSVRTVANQVEVPAFCIAAWHDVLLGNNLDHFCRLKAEAATELARKNTRLLVGPWAHAAFLPFVGELNFGLSASQLLLELKRDLTTLQLQWFDHWLRGVSNGIESEAPVKLFVMGENRWRDEQEWPLARTRYTNYYLRSGGNANTRRGDGRLSTDPPGREEPDRFAFDPRDPVPTTGGNTLLPMNYGRGPVNQALVEDREDVLVYTTEPLASDLEVTGPIEVRLFAVSSAPDTDFTAKLVDVYPDGRAFNLADGIIRARYRGGDVPPSFIEPGRVYEYRIDLWATSNVFLAGHRIRVEVSSSNFPRFDRNLNTGKLGRDSAELAVARQTVLHDEGHASHIVLPVIPR